MQKSESIVELAKALSVFQGQIVAVKKDALNPFYKKKYATLDTIWEAIRKPLSANGLSVAQTIGLQDGKSILETTLYHSSGEWISGIMLVNPVKDDPQSLGSAISYARRYSLSAMLGIVADEDDDAEKATDKQEELEGEQKEIPKMTTKQGSMIFALANERGIIEEVKAYIASRFGKAHTRELNKAEASQLIEAIEKGQIEKTKD